MCVARNFCLNIHRCQSQFPGWEGGQCPFSHFIHPSFHDPSIHCASNGDSKMDSRWPSSQKEIPWEAQSDPTSSRDVPEGCRPSTLFSSSATCSSIIELSQFFSIALFLSVSWAKPWMSSRRAGLTSVIPHPQWVAHSKCSINTGWINKWTTTHTYKTI